MDCAPRCGFGVLQQLDELGQHFVQQRLVATVVREGVEHRRQGATCPVARSGARPLDEALHLRILHRLQRSRRQPHRLRAPAALALPGAVSHCEPLGRVVPADQRHERRHVQKLVAHKGARLRPMRAWLRAMTAVCGMGRPSGLRNNATTANQSASAPTMAASAMAFTALSHRPRSTTLVAMNTAVTSNSRPSV